MPKNQNVCKKINFNDCELTILRMAVDEAETKLGRRIVNTDEVQKIIDIVEEFIKHKHLICYGGTAINNILPEEDHFYDKSIEIPDYDFFSENALNDTKELADIYYKKGFINVEAKAGQHYGTYKVFVNYMAVADITQVPRQIYKVLKKDSLSVGGILYAPVNFLRMSMYLELSRPAGDVSRWEKVLKRLALLNKNYNVTNINCSKINFQRKMANQHDEAKIFNTLKNVLISQGVVFFGGYANSLYSQYMPKKYKTQIMNAADFDVLSNDPETTAEIIKERLDDNGIKNVKIIKHDSVGELVPQHYEIKIGNDTVVFIYKPIGCHSYNVLHINEKKIKIATIDTMLSFYLAFLYADRSYYNQFIDRILCMSKFLFDVQQKNRLSQKGLLKRFSITCYGHQKNIVEIKEEKSKKYKELKENKNKKEFEEWFLSYKPDNEYISKKEKKEVSKTKKKKSKINKLPSSEIINVYGKKTRKRLY